MRKKKEKKKNTLRTTILHQIPAPWFLMELKNEFRKVEGAGVAQQRKV